MKSGCADHHLLRIGFQQRGDLPVGQFRMQPALLVAVMQDNRHPAIPVVDVAHHRIRLGGYDRIRHYDLVRIAVDPAVENARKGDDRPILYRHVVGSLLCLPVVPPEKSAHRDQAPPPADRNPERSVFKNSFRTRDDRLIADRHGLGGLPDPIRDQPPAEILYLLVSDNYRIREVRKGTYMVCRSEFSDQIGFTAETPGQFFGSGSKGDMITHGTRWFILLRPAGPTAKKSREHNCGHSLRFSHCKSYFVAFVKLPSLSKSRTVLSESATL